MTELVPTPALDEAAARRLTERIRLTVDAINGQVEKLADLVRQAYEGRAWATLGYDSWQAYVEAEIPRVRLDRVERRELVADLADAGMSTRAIAPVIGATHMTVARDLSEGVTNVTPERQVTGIDGKTYTAAPRTTPVEEPQGEVDDEDVVEAELVEPAPTPVQPPAPRRRPITDVARDAGWDLHRAVERVERVINDDRFRANKGTVTALLRGHLEYAIRTCQALVEQLPELERNH